MKKLMQAILTVLSVISLSIPPPQPAVAAVPGGTLDPTTIPKFVTPLFVPPTMPKTSSGATLDYYEIAARQFQQQILPAGLPATTVWGYGSVTDNSSFHSPSATIEATYNKSVRVKWINGLVNTAGQFLPPIIPVDQTLHWANPPGGVTGRDMNGTSQVPYAGPVPLVTHLHGAHVTEESDGFPESWYLPAANNIPAGYATEGSLYAEFKAKGGASNGQVWQPGSAVFQYPNDQRATTLWYHDHALGMTRTNVYAGLAGLYLIRGGPADLASGVLPSGAYEIPLVIQDKSFNSDGSLFYPDNRAFFEGLSENQLQIPFAPDAAIGGASDVAPIWNPEFFGNTMVVNGSTWPYLQVEQHQYRFRVLNASDTRFMILKLSDNASFSLIGTDGGFLPAPVALTQLLLAPSERADVVIDFTNVPVSSNVTLQNIGPDEPFGGGTPGIDFAEADPDTTGQVMQFRIVTSTSPDTSTPAAQLTLPTVTGVGQSNAIRQVSLNELSSGTVTVAVNPDGTWQLDANGNVVVDPDGEPFGPTEAELGTVNPDGTGNPIEFEEPLTENPALNTAETWEIYNFTEDAHPIHVHQVQFQVIERQDIASGDITGPEDWETGYKDTVISYPGQVTRIKAKFDISGLYVWHCHILSHEDNEMMRPFYVGTPLPSAPSDLSAIIMSATRVDLIWTDQSTSEAGFRIERSLDGFATAPSATFTATVNQRTFTDNTVSANNTYSYRIIAVNAQGESALSNVATARVTSKLQVGPIDPASIYQGNPNTGSPGYYQDDQGTRVALLPITGNGLTAPTMIFDNPVAGNAYSQFLGFGTEAFYYDATNVFTMPNGGRVVTVFGIEHAFGGAGAAVPGQEFVFNRTRIRVDVPMAGIYTVQHPYGTLTFNVTQADFVATGGKRAINYTSDIGVPRDFAAAANDGIMTRFLRQTTPTPPAGWIGDGASIGPVTGSPTGFNAVRITGPAGSNLGGPGIDFIQSNNFMVSGRMPTAVTPLPSFSQTVNPVSGIAPATVTFTDTSTGAPTKWLWDFGDGTTSTSQNATKIYNAAGNYLVRLTISNAVATVATSRTVTIIEAPAASFTHSLPNGLPPVTINFTDNSIGNPTSWLWHFGDNTTSTLQNPSHTYTAAGNYSVNLTAANTAGTSATSRALGISTNLTASFTKTTSPASGIAPVSANFTDTSSGNITSRLWNFGDGTTSTSQNATRTYDTAGNYTVTLTVTDAAGAAGTSQVISVYGTQTASFTMSPAFGTVPLTVNFTDNSTGNPVSWLWNFGDNTTSTLQNPSKTYAAFGRYTVTLTVTNPTGPASTSQTVTVSTVDPTTLLLQVGPINLNSIYQDNLNTGLPSYYQDDQGTRVALLPLSAGQIFDLPVAGNAYSQFLGYGTEAFYWLASTVSPTSVGQMKTVFGIEAAFGGAGDAVPGQEFVFARTRIVADVPVAGTYTFQHPYGTVTIPVTAADIASGRAIFYTSDMGVQRDFLAAAAPDNGNVSRFLHQTTPTPPVGWIGDGAAIGPVTGSPTGFNKVRLTGPAGSNLGGPGIDFVETNQFSVSGRLFSTVTPSFTMGLNPANGAAPVAVTFTNTTSSNITAWSWNFGDGTTSTLQNPSPKTYNTPGTYTVSLTVTDNTSAVGTTSQILNVLGAPVAAFTKSVSSGVAPLVVDFTDTSTGVPTSWLWNFGDGTTSTLQNPTKTYTVAGTFTVTLTVTNAVQTASTSQTVTVTALVIPVASFTMSAVSGLTPLTINFTDTSSGVPTSWLWNFGDGTTSPLQNPAKTYNAAGTFTVTLTATNLDGSSSTSQTVVALAVALPPVAAPPVVTTPGITLTGLTSTAGLVVNTAGIATNSATLTTTTGKVQLAVAEGTRLRTADGQPLSTITAAPLTVAPPKSPPRAAVILPVDFGPDGANFNPPLTITMTFDPATIPPGVRLNNLKIAYWDGKNWLKLGNTTVNTSTNIITGQVSHFTTFAILAEQEDEVVAETTSTPTLTTEPAPPSVPPAIPPSAAGPAPTTTTEPTSLPTPGAIPGFNWGLVGGGIAGAILIIVLALFIRRRLA